MESPFWKVLVVVLACVVAGQAVVLLALLRQVGGLFMRLNPDRVGDLGAGPMRGAVLQVPVPPKRPALLMFVSPGCSLCEPLREAIPVVRTHYPEVEVLAIVIGDDLIARQQYAAQYGSSGRADLAHLAQDWEIRGTPFVIGVDENHRVRDRGVVNSLDQLEALAEEVLRPVDPNDDALPETEKELIAIIAAEDLAVGNGAARITPIEEFKR